MRDNHAGRTVTPRRREFLAGLGTATVLGLAGCSGSGETEPETTIPGTTTPTPAEPEPTEPDGPHSWRAEYTSIHTDSFESAPDPQLRLNHGATLTETGIDGQRSVRLGTWGSIETNPEALPLSPDTIYLVELEYRLLDPGSGDSPLACFFYPADSTSDQDAVHCHSMLPNVESSGTFATGGLTTATADRYRLMLVSPADAEIVIDNFELVRVDAVPRTSPPDRWAEVASLPFPRLGNYQLGSTRSTAVNGGGVVPDWPEGEPVYQPEGIEERLAMFDVVVGPNFGIQTMDSAYVKRLREHNPNIVVMPYRITYEQGTEKPRPPHATIDPTIEFLDGLADEWFVTDTDGSRVLDADAPYIRKLNFSEYCPSVDGQTYNDYLVDWVVNNLGSGLWDGIFFDNLDARANSHIEDVHDPARFDYDINRNGMADETPADVSEMARRTTPDLLARLRDELGDAALIIGNNGWHPERCTAPYLNGYTFESWMAPWFGIGNDRLQPDEGAWKRSLDEYFVAEANTRSPHLNILEGGGHEGEIVLGRETDRNYLEPTARDIERHRFGLGTALLGNGFYEYDLYDSRSAPYWFDEYAVDPDGVAIEDPQYKGYLGQPIADAEEFRSSQTLIWEPDLDVDAADLEGDYEVADGKLVITNPTGAATHSTSAKTKPDSVHLAPDRPHVVEFDWEILETLEWRYSAAVTGSAGLLGSYTIPSVIEGESGSVRFPVTPAHGSDFSLEFVLFNGGAVATDGIKLFEGGAGPWRRDFENGFVLVNPLNTPHTCSPTELAGDLERTGIRRIRGTQAPDVNDGQAVTGSLILQPFDAIVLLADPVPAS